jgi:hypothetical protein
MAADLSDEYAGEIEVSHWPGHGPRHEYLDTSDGEV